MFLLWKNEANGKRHGDDTNHMTPRLRLHWLAHAVFLGAMAFGTGLLLFLYRNGTLGLGRFVSPCEDASPRYMHSRRLCVQLLAQQAPTQQLCWIEFVSSKSPHMH
jgi:hypothetical protein